MSERNYSKNKKNKSRVKAKDRAYFPSMQRTYRKPEKVSDTLSLFV